MAKSKSFPRSFLCYCLHRGNCPFIPHILNPNPFQKEHSEKMLVFETTLHVLQAFTVSVAQRSSVHPSARPSVCPTLLPTSCWHQSVLHVACVNWEKGTWKSSPCSAVSIVLWSCMRSEQMSCAAVPRVRRWERLQQISFSSCDNEITYLFSNF